MREFKELSSKNDFINIPYGEDFISLADLKQKLIEFSLNNRKTQYEELAKDSLTFLGEHNKDGLSKKYLRVGNVERVLSKKMETSLFTDYFDTGDKYYKFETNNDVYLIHWYSNNNQSVRLLTKNRSTDDKITIEHYDMVDKNNYELLFQ